MSTKVAGRSIIGRQDYADRGPNHLLIPNFLIAVGTGLGAC